MNKFDRNSDIISDYMGEMPMYKVCDKYNLHRSTVQSILKKGNIKLRKRKSEIKCDKNFFSVYTPESCYWAGFILADGNIRPNRNSLQLKLAIVDYGHLIKFMDSIKCTEYYKVKKYVDYCAVTICLDKFKNDLIKNFDILPRKTYTCSISNKIPESLLPHYIRGYFDGDGSITITTTKTINFTGTVEVLNFLQKVFFNLGVRLKSKNTYPPIQNEKNNIGQISYSGKNSKIILDWWYKNADLYLDRKHKLYEILYQIPN